MIRKPVLTILLLCSLQTLVIAQYVKVKEIKTASDYFSSDSENNVYYTTDDSIFKVIPPYDSLYSAPLTGHGSPLFIDVSNPEYCIILFSVSGEILILDSTFRQILNFYLEELGFYDVSAIISGKDRSMWFYNYYSNILRKLNRNFIPVADVVELNNYFDPPGQNMFITAHDSSLYINVPSAGILVLNQKGKYITSYPLKGVPDFQVKENYIYYYRDNVINRFDRSELKTTACPLPGIREITNAHYLFNGFAIQTKDKILIYKSDDQMNIKFY